ncbi:hypothetical protein [Cobetia crustatorum]|uniref:hypothetical protein n=1 Tax=Cobetia crustatorum TaxID=553385 RepID=UPI0004B67B8E|nr:hypothetical protein [Cobetia crustatorum]
MLTFYSYPNSRSLRVAWALEELGIEYQIHSLDLKSGEGRSLNIWRFIQMARPRQSWMVS